MDPEFHLFPGFRKSKGGAARLAWIVVTTLLCSSFNAIAAPIDGRSLQGRLGDGTTTSHFLATQQERLVANDGADFDALGLAVAISGDTAVVGAPGDDEDLGSATSSIGSAYVFEREGATWTQQTKISVADAVDGDFVGASVAVFGDTALIGSPGDEDAGVDSGSVYVFVRTGSTWTQEAKLVASDAATVDEFGTTVALFENTAVVGARFNDDAGRQSGSAYVFVRSGSTWTQQAKLVAPDAEAGDQFGFSVALHGETLVVGSIGDDDGGESSGSAYVFSRSGFSWTQQAKLLASDAAPVKAFGNSLALLGDTLIVGAPGRTEELSGSAYVFARTGTSWVEESILVPPVGRPGDTFGWSSALSEHAALIGSQTGSAYVFVRSASGWTAGTNLSGATAATANLFGSSVAISKGTAVVGAAREDALAAQAGAAYVFLLTSESCGDGNVDALEECDDGNNDDSDGCTTSCILEPDFDCSESSPSDCSTPEDGDDSGCGCQTSGSSGAGTFLLLSIAITLGVRGRKSGREIKGRRISRRAKGPI